MKYKLEYIWLDGYEPVPNLRSKTKLVDFDTEPTLEQLPLWNFDGSSTRQADGSSSDCFLQPVSLFPDPARNRAYLVMCEVLLPDGTPHPSNSRASISDDSDAWFGFEQEYFLYQDGSPLGFPKEGFPAPQGDASQWTRVQTVHSWYHNADYTMPEPYEDYPSHLHIDLLERAQGHGYGRRMMEMVMDKLRRRGSPGAHLGVSTLNASALAFYLHLGFRELTRVGSGSDGCIYLGKSFR